MQYYRKMFGKVIYENLDLIDICEHRYFYKKFFLWYCYTERHNLTLVECINEGIYQFDETGIIDIFAKD